MNRYLKLNFKKKLIILIVICDAVAGAWFAAAHHDALLHTRPRISDFLLHIYFTLV